MDELTDLYQEAIIDHSHKPRNFRTMADASYSGEGYNPLCGDKLTLYINEANGVITDISFQGHGCAIFMASTSLMTEAVKGKTAKEINELYDGFHKLITTGDDSKIPAEKTKLKVMQGVVEYPMRVKCAILPWHTLKMILAKDNKKLSYPVKTE